ncbi:MAG: DUF4920 domain-containing protein [Pyrinomonadaceae bacterium]
MKTFLVTLLLIACGAAVAADTTARQHQHAHGSASKPEAEKSDAGSASVVKRGEPLGESPAASFADVLKQPLKYAGKRVRIEGVVERVCQAEGCWMQITPEAGVEGVRVTFKNHSFFVPKDSKSMKFRAEGEFAVKVLSKAQADHLVEDGAVIKRNDDGTANEISFVATGVELWK